MPLIQTSNGGDGEFTVYVKFNAKSGRWKTKEDRPDAEEYELEKGFAAVWDFANIRTGWFLFAAGVAPQKVYNPSIMEMAPKPGEGFKQGFELRMFSDKNLGGVREFSSTANSVIERINVLYDDYVAAPERAQGKLPVVQFTGLTEVTNKHGTNYTPNFAIVQWVDRPAELGPLGNGAPAAAAASPAAAANSPAPSTGHVPPPAAKQMASVEF